MASKEAKGSPTKGAEQDEKKAKRSGSKLGKLVRSGSFKLGKKDKEKDAEAETSEPKPTTKKPKKQKSKSESAGAETSKPHKPSKASQLVRKLSMGKMYKSAKTPSPTQSSTALAKEVVREEVGGRQGPEGDDFQSPLDAEEASPPAAIQSAADEREATPPAPPPYTLEGTASEEGRDESPIPYIEDSRPSSQLSNSVTDELRPGDAASQREQESSEEADTRSELSRGELLQLQSGFVQQYYPQPPPPVRTLTGVESDIALVTSSNAELEADIEVASLEPAPASGPDSVEGSARGTVSSSPSELATAETDLGPEPKENLEPEEKPPPVEKSELEENLRPWEKAEPEDLRPWEEAKPEVNLRRWEKPEPEVNIRRWEKPEPEVNIRRWEKTEPEVNIRRWEKAEPEVNIRRWEKVDPEVNLRRWEKAEPEESPRLWKNEEPDVNLHLEKAKTEESPTSWEKEPDENLEDKEYVQQEENLEFEEEARSKLIPNPEEIAEQDESLEPEEKAKSEENLELDKIAEPEEILQPDEKVKPEEILERGEVQPEENLEAEGAVSAEGYVKLEISEGKEEAEETREPVVRRLVWRRVSDGSEAEELKPELARVESDEETAEVCEQADTSQLDTDVPAAWMSQRLSEHVAKPRSLKGKQQAATDTTTTSADKNIEEDIADLLAEERRSSERFLRSIEESLDKTSQSVTAEEEEAEQFGDNLDHLETESNIGPPEMQPSAISASAEKNATAQQSGDKREHLYKILVIGELGTGKTSIIKRYVHQFFSQHYRATIGVDFALKVLNWDTNSIIRLQLWDIAGQERFGNMTRVYYKEAVGAFIVFDVTRAATFDAVVKWKQDLDTKVQLPDGSPIPCVLLANKCDQQKEGLVNSPGKMDEYCKEKGFVGWYETSAKENINIEEAAKMLVTKILQNDKMIHQNDTLKDSDKFAIDGKNSSEKSGKSCSC